MIYLVSNKLFDTDIYKICTIKESLEMLEPLRIVGVDTETKGFDPYTKDLLLVQLGNKDIQIVIDCTSINLQHYKEYLESSRLFLFWNAKFDLRFFLHKRILIKNVYDGYLAEKLLYLGYPSGFHGMSLADATFNYLQVTLNKEVRGMINYRGPTDDLVVEYAANDVRYLELIRDKQLELIKRDGLSVALNIENEFVKVLAYIEYSGIKLDVVKWKEKMESDLSKLTKAKEDLDNWVTTNLPDSKFVYINRQGSLFDGYDLTPRCNINWNSSKQIIPLLEQLGFNLLVKDKDTGGMKRSTEVDVLIKQSHISTIIEPYKRYSESQKAVSTYGQGFIDSINPITKRIHTQFNQLMDTSRLSSGGKDKDTGQENINLQWRLYIVIYK